MKLLILSNGHGEDVIAVKILEQLQHHSHPPKLAALPLVGEGHAYKNLDITLLGPRQQMPSGGFITMDQRQLWQDLKEGLFNLTQQQYQIVRQWGQQGGKILAVGDILPLLLAWLSGSDYAFVGTAKSEYYLQDDYGWLPQTSPIYQWSGSYYFPWERFLMSRSRCKAVFPRDSLTTEVLRRWSIPAFDLGNPMMDYINPQHLNQLPTFKPHTNQLTLLLLPGSRSPEAQRNWRIIISAVMTIITNLKNRNLVFLAAIAPALPIASFQEYITEQGWQIDPHGDVSKSLIADSQAKSFKYDHAQLILTQNAYPDCLMQSQMAIAMAGTATEQFVGLGKPAITIVGEGPQFTSTFAEAQTRLLGMSVTLVKDPQQVVEAIQSLLQDPDRWQGMINNGKRRMGSPGAAKRIAQSVIERLS